MSLNVSYVICRDGTATVASGSVVSKGSLIGRGSIVESGTRLERSIIGINCHIGRGAFLQNGLLHSGVRVDDSCRVASAVLGEQVVVRAHARVEVRTRWALWRPKHTNLSIVCLLVSCHHVFPAGTVQRQAVVLLGGLCDSFMCGLQVGAVLAKHTVVDTAHSVPAGTCVSLIQHNAGGAGSDDEVEWGDKGAQQATPSAAIAWHSCNSMRAAPIMFKARSSHGLPCNLVQIASI